MPVVGAYGVVEAVYEFLTATGVGYTDLAGELNAYRIAQSIETTVLPDPQTIERPLYRGSQAPAAGVYVAVEWEGSAREAGNNSRKIQHRIVVGLVVPDAAIAGDEAAVMTAALRYEAVLRSMFLRNTPAGASGFTLNNGGTGAALGRIIRCEVDRTDVLYDSELSGPNALLVMRLFADAREDYP